MQISNNLVATNFNSSVQDERQVKPEQSSRTDAPSRRSANASVDIDQDEIQRRGEALQATRVQRLNDIESAPLKTQQALNSYQQTEVSAQEFEQGELVGVDLFV